MKRVFRKYGSVIGSFLVIVYVCLRKMSDDPASVAVLQILHESNKFCYLIFN